MKALTKALTKPQGNGADCSFVGYPGGAVYVDSQYLPGRQDLCNHSPAGFSWGYGGSGPAQLALAILAWELSENEALDWYQHFEWDVIAKLPQGEPWSLTSTDVREWVGRRMTSMVYRISDDSGCFLAVTQDGDAKWTDWREAEVFQTLGVAILMARAIFRLDSQGLDGCDALYINRADEEHDYGRRVRTVIARLELKGQHTS